MRSGSSQLALWRTNGEDVDHSRILRPLSKRSGYHQARGTNSPPRLPPVILKQTYPWSKWPEVTIKLRSLHEKTTTYDIWRSFQRHGNIKLIEIYENRNGQREGAGKIRFSPPPREPFWTKLGSSNLYMIKLDNKGNGYNCRVEFEGNRRYEDFLIQSPIRPHIRYRPTMKMIPTALHFGVMVDPQSMMSMETIRAIPGDELSFVVDLRRNRIVVTFMVEFVDPRSRGDTSYVSDTDISSFDRKNKYMFEIPFAQLKTIHRVDLSDDVTSLIVSLASPPAFYRKREAQEGCHSRENLLWTEFDAWYRQTDIVYDPYILQTATVTTLHKDKPVIDIGRWTTYNFVFNTIQNELRLYNEIKQALQDFNIDIVMIGALQLVPARQAQLWSLINHPISQGGAAEVQHLNGGEGSSFLPFEVRYQLEVCISRDILNEHNISEAFITRLVEIASEDPSKARNILEYIAEHDQRVYHPMSVFEDKQALAYSSKTEIPHYCAYTRKATITPSTIYFSSPTVETTNRVLRHYAQENKDGRFLRVQFTDEMAEGRINACADKQRNDELFTRVYRTLFNGIRIGDRHYEFLAFGNSQFRENGAYFFCPTDHLSCDDIRQWMGNFTHIKVVAKYAARLGQCFSTTRAIHGLSKPDIIKIPDIERNGYCFTDGVGKISSFLAQMITAELGLRVSTAPSAFQFRLGGCKGILVVSPDARDKEVHIRKSQQKFTATYNGLEIIRWSRFSCATLNRQTITILSSLGVPDEVFVKMLVEQLGNYQSAMTDNALAQAMLSKYIDDNQMTINIATMINNGFMTEREPFVLSLLHLWRSWSIKLLKEKAKIMVEDGAFLLGCVDETGSLRGYRKPTVSRGEFLTKEDLPQIFVQIPSKDDPYRYNVVQGICLVGRNPSLHPGDLRVVEAVNIPALHHLRDVIVFPQTGERDVPSMCSGGDLDGDDFFVIWDEALQPLEWNCNPMDYAAPEPKSQSSVQVTDLMKFFVRFMKNDSLPTIAHAHLAQSDFLTRSVMDPKCLELAALHSKAVDYVKTGQPAEMPKHLRPRQWPHFMEKKHKSKNATYHSDKILGQLYDKVESVDFIPQYKEPFDKRILRAYKLDDNLLKTIRQTKSQYDTAMLRIMAQQEIKTEFEIWSTFVLSKPRVGSDYKVQEEVARISDALKDRFRLVCIELAGGKDFSILGPFVAGMYKVTKEEMDIALAECRSTKIVGGREVPKRRMVPKSMPLISFPWLFEKELARIATGIEGNDDLEGLGLQSLELKGDTNPSRKRAGGAATAIDFDDYIQQEDGRIVHRGEELDLFRADVDSNNPSSESDFADARVIGDEQSLEAGESGEVDQNASFQTQYVSNHLHGNTGVEDVVPRTVLDGFVDPRQGSRLIHGLRSNLEPVGIVREGAVDHNTPNESTIINPDCLSGSFADMTLLNDGLPNNATAELDRQSIDVEEEMVDLNVGESSLEKLARMLE